WQVLMDGTEISQFTYFQQCGGLELPIVSAELTYGLDRIGMMLQGKDRVQDLAWAPGVTWGDLWLRNEVEWSHYNFEQAPVEELPAGYVEPALEQLELGVCEGLEELRLSFGAATTYGTPRRLAIRVTDVAARQRDHEEEAMGPAARVAFDAAGQPSKALLGF